MIVFDVIEIPTNGIVFIYSSWSPTKHHLDHLILVLNTYFSHSTINLYIIDIDSNICENFSTHYNIRSHGYGETFWLLNEKVIKQITNHEKEKGYIYDYTKYMLSFWQEL